MSINTIYNNPRRKQRFFAMDSDLHHETGNTIHLMQQATSCDSFLPYLPFARSNLPECIFASYLLIYQNNSSGQDTLQAGKSVVPDTVILTSYGAGLLADTCGKAACGIGRLFTLKSRGRCMRIPSASRSDKVQAGARRFSCFRPPRRFTDRTAILTFLAFAWKMLYLCNSQAGRSTRKSRFLRGFEDNP